MNINKFFRKVITGILGFLLVATLATSAGASTMTGFAGGEPNVFFSDGTSFDLDGFLSITPFNPLLGTLTGVTLRPIVSVQGQLTVFPYEYIEDTTDPNNPIVTPVPPPFFIYGATNTLDFGAIITGLTVPALFTHSFGPATLSDFSFNGLEWVGAPQTNQNPLSGDPPIIINVPGAKFGMFTGGTDVIIPITLFGFTDNPAYSSLTYQGGAGLEYEYTYTSVPEPATMLLLGLGLIGLAGVRKRMVK